MKGRLEVRFQPNDTDRMTWEGNKIHYRSVLLPSLSKAKKSCGCSCLSLPALIKENVMRNRYRMLFFFLMYCRMGWWNKYGPKEGSSNFQDGCYATPPLREHPGFQSVTFTWSRPMNLKHYYSIYFTVVAAFLWTNSFFLKKVRSILILRLNECYLLLWWVILSILSTNYAFLSLFKT